MSVTVRAAAAGLASLCCMAAVLPAAVDSDASLSAARKLQRLADGQVESGLSVVLSQDELNAFLQYHAVAGLPDGVTDPEVTLRKGGAVIRADLDLAKAGASSEGLPMLMRLLLRGTRSVALDLDFEGRDGYATTKLNAVMIDDTEISGGMLEWLLESFAPPELTRYLGGEPSELQAGVRSIRLEPGRAVIVAK